MKIYEVKHDYFILGKIKRNCMHIYIYIYISKLCLAIIIAIATDLNRSFLLLLDALDVVNEGCAHFQHTVIGCIKNKLFQILKE